ncbi:MAG: hypothetical protein ISQ08_01260 [Planctomycetes bacterium]|nr:hypothetical protein [Planctomycetota bacterium]
MNENTPRGLRWTIRGLSVLLLFLFIWLEGFIVGDIDRMEGPSARAFTEATVEPETRERAQSLQVSISSLEREIARLEELKANRIETRDSANATLNQFKSQYQFAIERNEQPSEALTAALDKAQASFLEASSAFEEANQRIAELQEQIHLARVEAAIAERALQGEQARGDSEYRKAYAAHRFKVAAFKMLVVVPLFLGAAFLTARRKGSMFGPIHRALLVATFWWVGVVMFEHFPKEYFKYIAIGAATLIVLAFLVRSLRNAAKPQDEVLLRRRREAYQAGRCPECAYPIPQETGQPMACASCGSDLFEQCGSCDAVRHALLPNCRSCGTATQRWRGTESTPSLAPNS